MDRRRRRRRRRRLQVLPAVACPKTCATQTLTDARTALADALSTTSLRLQNNITRLLLVDSSDPAAAMSVKVGPLPPARRSTERWPP